MIKPLPEESSSWRLTLVPGVVSVSSTEGIESPTLTIIAVVVLKLRWIEVLYGGMVRERMRDVSMELQRLSTSGVIFSFTFVGGLEV